MKPAPRLAIIGLGHWGPNLLRVASGLAEVVALVDVDPAALARLDCPPTIARGADALAVLDDPRLDAVLVATPTSTHVALARAALERGKHVFVEKPLTVHPAEALALHALAEQARRTLMVGHIFLFNAAVRHVQQVLAQGALGPLRLVSMTRANFGPVRRDASAAVDLATHDLSMLDLWLDGALPVTASAVGGAFLRQGVADAAFITLRYPSGLLANLRASWLAPAKERGVWLVGEQAMLSFDDLSAEAPLRLVRKRVDPSGRLVDDGVEVPHLPQAEPLASELRHFLRCVASGEAPVSGAPLAARLAAVLEAIAESMAQGGVPVAVRAPPPLGQRGPAAPLVTAGAGG